MSHRPPEPPLLSDYFHDPQKEIVSTVAQQMAKEIDQQILKDMLDKAWLFTGEPPDHIIKIYPMDDQSVWPPRPRGRWHEARLTSEYQE